MMSSLSLPRAAALCVRRRLSPSTSSSSPSALARLQPRTIATSRPLLASEQPNVRFDSFELDREILSRIKHPVCTPVQAQTMGPILEGLDVLAQAKTGTGKTLGFVVPVLQSLLSDRSRRTGDVSALVISPTRELASQIHKVVQEVSPSRFRSQVVYGATNVNTDVNRLQNGADILVGTPGRLLDLVQNHGLDSRLRGVKHVIFDEMDTLLEGGFLRDLTKIIAALPNRQQHPRQTLCFSATMPQDVKKVVSAVLNPDYEHISTLDPNESNTHDRVPQSYAVVPMRDLFSASLKLINAEKARNPAYKIMVFATTARGTQALDAAFGGLLNFGPHWQVHSRMSQPARNKAVEAFRNAPQGVLFTSDVTARGIDIPDVSFVLQVSAPSDTQQYIHRLGRTARAGKDGAGALLLTPSDEKFLRGPAKALPINRSTLDLQDLTKERAEMSRALAGVDDDLKSKAYVALLGYLGQSTKDRVAVANDFAMQTLGCRELPGIEKKILGKMGLKNAPGIRVIDSR